jgi:hypothetical protein
MMGILGYQEDGVGDVNVDGDDVRDYARKKKMSLRSAGHGR